MKRLVCALAFTSLVFCASAEDANFRYTLNVAVETPEWHYSDSFFYCVTNLVRFVDPGRGNPFPGAGHMVIEVLKNVSVDDSDIGFTHNNEYWWWRGGSADVDMTIRSGGPTRQTFTYTGTKGIKTWGSTCYIFSNIVMTASKMAANKTFFDDMAGEGLGTKLMDGAAFANSSCRAIRLSNKPITLYPGSSISGNTSSGNGGGVLIDAADKELILRGGTITGNTAAHGGGVYLAAAGKVVYAGGGSVVSGNTSTADPSGAGAGVSAAETALPCFRVEAVPTAPVFDYYAPAQAIDGLVYGTYTVEDPDLTDHFVCKCALQGASIVTENGQVKVQSSVTSPVRYSTDGGTSWLPANSLRLAMESATGDGTTIIELLADVDYSSDQLFQSHRFTLRSKPDGVRRTVTLKNGAFFWLNKTDVVLTNVVFTAESGFANTKGMAIGIQGDKASLTMLDGAVLRDIPTTAVAEYSTANAGSRFTLGAGAKIVRCGAASKDAGAFISQSGHIAFELRGGEISSCVGKFGGVYLKDGTTVQIFADSVVTGNVNAASATANVYQCRPGAVVIAADAVTGANDVHVAVPYGNDGELVASLADGLAAYEVPATALKSDENADATVVRTDDGICWSTTRAHKDFRYSYDGLLFYEADTFKAAYISPKVNNTPLTVELMRDAIIRDDDSDTVNNNGIYFNRQLILRSHGAMRRTLTRKGGSHHIFLWSGAANSMVSNVVLTADADDYGGTTVLQAGSGPYYFGEDCEIRPPQGVRAVYLGVAATANFVLLPGAKITGGNLEAEGAAVWIASTFPSVLDVRGGEISGNTGYSAIYIDHVGGKVFVSGGARITDNFTQGGTPSNVKFRETRGLLVQTGDLAEGADVRLSRNDVKGGVFGVSSNVTDGCYQAFAGSRYIHSDVRKRLYGTPETVGDAVNLVWTKDSRGMTLILR